MSKGVYLRRAGRAAWIVFAGALLATPGYAQKRAAPPQPPR